MGMCKGCSEVFSALDMKDGYCKSCQSIGIEKFIEEKELANEKETEIKYNIRTKNFLEIVTVTTETMLTNIDGNSLVVKRLGIVTSERVYGLNVIKDFFAGIKDLIGGRVWSIEEPLHEGKIEVIEELQKKAYLLGANAVIGLSIEHSSSSVLSISAIGTAVVIDS